MRLLQIRLWQLGKLLPPRLAEHLEAHAVLPVLYVSRVAAGTGFACVERCSSAYSAVLPVGARGRSACRRTCPPYALHPSARPAGLLLAAHLLCRRLPAALCGAGHGRAADGAPGGLARAQGAGGGGRAGRAAARAPRRAAALRLRCQPATRRRGVSGGRTQRSPPWHTPAARLRAAAQVAVGLVSRCERDLLRMADFEEMVHHLRQVGGGAAGDPQGEGAWGTGGTLRTACGACCCCGTPALDAPACAQEVPRWPRQALQDVLTDALRWARAVRAVHAEPARRDAAHACCRLACRSARSAAAPACPACPCRRLQQAVVRAPAQGAPGDQRRRDGDGGGGPREQPGAAAHLRGQRGGCHAGGGRQQRGIHRRRRPRRSGGRGGGGGGGGAGAARALAAHRGTLAEQQLPRAAAAAAAHRAGGRGALGRLAGLGPRLE